MRYDAKTTGHDRHPATGRPPVATGRDVCRPGDTPGILGTNGDAAAAQSRLAIQPAPPPRLPGRLEYSGEVSTPKWKKEFEPKKWKYLEVEVTLFVQLKVGGGQGDRKMKVDFEDKAVLFEQQLDGLSATLESLLRTLDTGLFDVKESGVKSEIGFSADKMAEAFRGGGGEKFREAFQLKFEAELKFDRAELAGPVGLALDAVKGKVDVASQALEFEVVGNKDVEVPGPPPSKWTLEWGGTAVLTPTAEFWLRVATRLGRVLGLVGVAAAATAGLVSLWAYLVDQALEGAQKLVYQTAFTMSYVRAVYRNVPGVEAGAAVTGDADALEIAAAGEEAALADARRFAGRVSPGTPWSDSYMMKLYRDGLRAHYNAANDQAARNAVYSVVFELTRAGKLPAKGPLD